MASSDSLERRLEEIRNLDTNTLKVASRDPNAGLASQRVLKEHTFTPDDMAALMGWYTQDPTFKQIEEFKRKFTWGGGMILEARNPESGDVLPIDPEFSKYFRNHWASLFMNFKAHQTCFGVAVMRVRKRTISLADGSKIEIDEPIIPHAGTYGLLVRYLATGDIEYAIIDPRTGQPFMQDDEMHLILSRRPPLIVRPSTALPDSVVFDSPVMAVHPHQQDMENLRALHRRFLALSADPTTFMQFVPPPQTAQNRLTSGASAAVVPPNVPPINAELEAASEGKRRVTGQLFSMEATVKMMAEYTQSVRRNTEQIQRSRFEFAPQYAANDGGRVGGRVVFPFPQEHQFMENLAVPVFPYDIAAHEEHLMKLKYAVMGFPAGLFTGDANIEVQSTSMMTISQTVVDQERRECISDALTIFELLLGPQLREIMGLDSVEFTITIPGTPMNTLDTLERLYADGVIGVEFFHRYALQSHGLPEGAGELHRRGADRPGADPEELLDPVFPEDDEETAAPRSRGGSSKGKEQVPTTARARRPAAIKQRVSDTKTRTAPYRR